VSQDTVDDLESDIAVSATVRTCTDPDMTTIIDTAIDAALNAEQAGAEEEIQAIVVEKGHHSTKVVALADDLGMRTYIRERAMLRRRRFGRRDDARRAGEASNSAHFSVNSWNLPSLMSVTLTERETWLRGVPSVAKRHLMMVNLSIIMREILAKLDFCS
jgi:hypothetical protein